MTNNSVTGEETIYDSLRIKVNCRWIKMTDEKSYHNETQNCFITWIAIQY